MKSFDYVFLALFQVLVSTLPSLASILPTRWRPARRLAEKCPAHDSSRFREAMCGVSVSSTGPGPALERHRGAPRGARSGFGAFGTGEGERRRWTGANSVLLLSRVMLCAGRVGIYLKCGNLRVPDAVPGKSRVAGPTLRFQEVDSASQYDPHVYRRIFLRPVANRGGSGIFRRECCVAEP